MFDIRLTDEGWIALAGRLDASQVDAARKILDSVNTTSVVNFKDLEYISSAGLGVLLAAQKRLSKTGQCLKLRGMSKHIREVFKYARLDIVFEIE